MYYVYMTINSNDPSKAYIGMTKKPISTGYKGSGYIIIKAINCYGNENFTRCDLGEFNTKDEAHFWEGFYIKAYKTHINQGGYNIHPTGGTGFKDGLHYSEEHRRKIKESNTGLKRSSETCKNIGLSKKGLHLSEEHKRKLRAIIGYNNGKHFNKNTRHYE